MSVYLRKSNDNIECAKYLNKVKQYYPSIIHSSYYSAFQLIKHILLNVLMRDEASLDEEQTFKKIGTHEFYNNLIVKHIGESDRILSLEINNELSILKNYRIESDYKKKEFEPFEYGLILKSAEFLLEKIQKKFNIK